jgi:hypothetical protein
VNLSAFVLLRPLFLLFPSFLFFQNLRSPSHPLRYGEGWRQQAERISWRICKTWLEAQITLINLEQAKIEEVFLPYLIMPGDKTLFETMEQNHFLLLDKHNT